ncbi:hypothetical protein M440DRAFT_1459689 [Trichoderma longibrachiatum ATCC 18648]|uniref:Uncharacterized protein n=1 Tax=Trichoderma longibrachiatum ATCC 18648 TaxID=983965 RepID=A0A2T4CJ32_TRILO|nr:hypothetical protein M440DRAFT_1459689 [Trichoderma longibrachiatum ATCC 18648]
MLLRRVFALRSLMPRVFLLPQPRHSTVTIEIQEPGEDPHPEEQMRGPGRTAKKRGPAAVRDEAAVDSIIIQQLSQCLSSSASDFAQTRAKTQSVPSQDSPFRRPTAGCQAQNVNGRLSTSKNRKGAEARDPSVDRVLKATGRRIPVPQEPRTRRYHLVGQIRYS